MAVNVLDLVRPKTVVLNAFGTTFVLPPANAYDWVGAVGIDPASLSGVFPGMASDEDLEFLYERWHDPDFGERCANTARSALGKGSGRDWWWSLNLTTKILASFSAFNGVMMRQGITLDMPFPDYLDAVYSLLYERGDEEARMKLDLELQVLPKGVPIRQSAAKKKEMMAAFAAD